MAGPFARLLETGRIDCFVVVVIVGLEGREGRMPLLADAAILGLVDQIPQIQVRRDDRPSNRFKLSITTIQVSCTTSSATSRSAT